MMDIVAVELIQVAEESRRTDITGSVPGRKRNGVWNYNKNDISGAGNMENGGWWCRVMDKAEDTRDDDRRQHMKEYI